MNYITELIEQIYLGVKLVYDKISVTLKNTNRNSKPGWDFIQNAEKKSRTRRENDKTVEER